MKIAKKGNMLIVGTKSIVLSSIKVVDHDDKFVYLVMSDLIPGQSRDPQGITIDPTIVDDPQTFASAALLHIFIDEIRSHTGVCNDAQAVTLSDSVDCVHGYLKVKNNGTGGVIKYTTVDGTTDSDQFDAGKVSEFRVKRVWSTTTAVNVTDIRIII